MEVHKSIANKLIDAVALSPPASSSPLRRKSIMVQQTNVLSSLSENDDEAERLARRREIDTTPIAGNTSDKRRSLGLNILVNMPTVQMVERISQCIKLGTENKINLKNAFSLHMIDFMTYMIKKQDVNMANLQMASMSLDVSTKIYGFRVDGVHMEILKMMGGLEQQEKNIEDARDNDAEPTDAEDTNESNEVRTKKKMKKKKVRQQVMTTVENLRTNVEVEKPILTSMESDLQTSDMLFQATLPNHAGSGIYPHPYNDILVDTVECKEVQDTDVGYSIPIRKVSSEMQICPPMFYFDFQNFDDANEVPEDTEPEKMNENTFQFDFNASLPEDNGGSYAGMNYFDMEDTEEEEVDRCVKLPDQVENIVDFRQVLASTVVSKPSEYSFIQKSLNIHWTGPSHWKSRNFRKMLGNSKVVEKCHQGPNKKKKEIELHYDHETKESTGAKFIPSKTVKMHIRTAKMEWNEEILTLPPDQHYDIVQANKLYIHTTMFEPPKDTDEMNTTHLSDNVDNYDYNNENDTSNYCPQADVNVYTETEENNATLGSAAVPTQPLTGTNLVAMPTLTNKTTIAYCGRAKKIDMKQLKHSIWTCLCTNSNTQDMEVDTSINEGLPDSSGMNGAKSFKKIYKILPTLLTKNNTEALSFPISFVSLLHLANEKSLQVIASPDMTDLIITQD